MALRTELRNFIRFQLAQLASQNKHHEFEHLAREFARLRICENVLPATGPVGSGGDQGRDFETFRTYLSSTPIAGSTFVACVDDWNIAFACSLAKEIRPKIRRDVKMICKSVQKVNAVYYFCETDLPVSQRHVLQTWCRKTYECDLEIFDGSALADQLAATDICWIAQQYLGVPADMFPTEGRQDTWYHQLKQRWLIGNQLPLNYSDFAEIKYGLREATFDVNARPDLVAWLNKIEQFLRIEGPAALRRNVLYEISVASLRGQNNLTARRNLVEEFFEGVSAHLSPSELDDATVLLSYCSSASLYGHFEIARERLVTWSKSLIAILEAQIASTTGAGTLCALLQTRGYACILPFREGPIAEPRVEDALDWWEQLLREVDHAPLFPLERFADLLTTLTPILGENDRFLRLVDATDSFLRNRAGGFAAAQKCYDRAKEYHKANKCLLAIQQLHRAKVQWFAAETIRLSLLTMLLLSRCYASLRLFHAARYYASAALYAAFRHPEDNVKRFIPRASFMICDWYYGAGECLSFVEAINVALLGHRNYDPDPLDADRHEEVNRLFGHFAILRAVTLRLKPDLVPYLDQASNEWPDDPEFIGELRRLSTSDDSPWQSMSVDEIWRRIHADIGSIPFCDLGPDRTIMWSALGIEWSVKFANEYDLSILAEEFVATLQIVQADLAAKDLCLLPTKVAIELQTVAADDVSIDEVPDNRVARWTIGLPRGWASATANEEQPMYVLAVTTAVLAQCTTLRHETFAALLRDAFRDGLATKAFSVRSPRELFHFILDRETFERVPRQQLSPPEPPTWFVSVGSDEMSWRNGPGPGYSLERSQELLRNRYAQGIRPIRMTLPRLLSEPRTKQLLKTMKERGLLDWQILNVVANAVVNYRVRHSGIDTHDMLALREKTKELMFREERHDDCPYDLADFTPDTITTLEQMLPASALQTWGLVVNGPRTPDFVAMKRFLDARYGHSSDDVEHDDYFSG